MKEKILGLLALEPELECDESTQRGVHLKNIAGLCAILGAAMIAATAWAAPPAKQPTVSVPVVVDSAGTIVGPVVPVINTDIGLALNGGLFGGTLDVAARYLNGGESGKIFFGGPLFPGNSASGADFRNLQLIGPFSLRFRQLGCQGQAYIDPVQLGFQENLGTGYRGVLGREFRGYGPLIAFPRVPGQTTPPFTPALFRIVWAQSTIVDPLDFGQASIFYNDGTCQDTSFPGGLVWPVNFVSTLSLVGPFSIR